MTVNFPVPEGNRKVAAKVETQTMQGTPAGICGPDPQNGALVQCMDGVERRKVRFMLVKAPEKSEQTAF